MSLEWIKRVCPLCGSANEARVFAESNIDVEALNQYAFASRKLPEYMHPRLVECGCGLLYGNPVLSPSSLAALYRDAAFDAQSESEFASHSYAKTLAKYLDHLPDYERAIDIGAGDGAFCERLIELGFSNVVGIEPSAAPVGAARPIIRKLLRQTMFRREDFVPNSASVISTFQVLEHVPEPLEFASAALEILKPRGLLLAVVHNQRALSAKILGTKSPIYDVEHLQLFNPETARKLLERAGFERISVSPLWNRYLLQYWMRLFPFPAVIKGGSISFATKTRLGRMPISLPAGNLVLTGFKP